MTEYTYRATPIPGGMNFIVGDNSMFIPLDLNNLDYQAFLAWVAEGNPAPEGWIGPTNQSG